MKDLFYFSPDETTGRILVVGLNELEKVEIQTFDLKISFSTSFDPDVSLIKEKFSSSYVHR